MFSLNSVVTVGDVLVQPCKLQFWATFDLFISRSLILKDLFHQLSLQRRLDPQKQGQMK